MIWILARFIFGGIIPYMARRFAKFMPATPAYALYRLVKPNKHTSRENEKYKLLKRKYVLRSLIYALICAGISAVVVYKFGELSEAWWIVFVWVMLLLAETDFKMYLLPDILTVPLLICGFFFAASSFNPEVGAFESALAALLGYAVPVVATILMLWKSKEAFGGGDIKLLSAIGAWLGVEGLLYTILISWVIFAVCMLIKRKRTGAFGPALSAAAIVYLLFLI